MKIGIKCEKCGAELDFKGDISTCSQCGEVLDWSDEYVKFDNDLY